MALLKFGAPRRGPVTPAFEPLVIAHRGASGHRPEHTLAAYEQAFAQGADSVELDLLATRDGVLVCRHDLELSRTTDVADRPEFAALRRTRMVDGEEVAGWFVQDFTAAELTALRARERWPKRRPASAAYDDAFAVPTFGDVIDLVERESARRGTSLRIHAELKEAEALARDRLSLPDLVKRIDGVLDRPEITWMSFDTGALRALDRADRTVQLLNEAPTPRQLGKVATYASGIGVRRRAVRPGAPAEALRVVQQAHAAGLEVLVWTHRAENRGLPKCFQVGADANAHGDAVGAAEAYYDLGIDGLITDFPDIAVVARTQAMNRPRSS